MSEQVFHLADISAVSFYEVHLEFTERFEPSSLSGDGVPFISVEDEIHANSSSSHGQKLRDEYGRIPYGSPLYLWEGDTEGRTEVLYIGQTMLQSVQKRFEGHASVMKLLADHVNLKKTHVYFRLCSRLDLKYICDNTHLIRAIEHFPLKQAKMIIDDIEAYLIFNLKPRYNKLFKNSEKQYSIPFTIDRVRNININE